MNQVLRSICNATLVGSLFLSTQSFAQDNIQVTVNGRNYQCGSTPGNEANVYYCDCNSATGWYVATQYKFNRANGTHTQVKTVGNSQHRTIAECRQEIELLPVCRIN